MDQWTFQQDVPWLGEKVIQYFMKKKEERKKSNSKQKILFKLNKSYNII